MDKIMTQGRWVINQDVPLVQPPHGMDCISANWLQVEGCDNVTTVTATFTDESLVNLITSIMGLADDSNY